MSGGSFYDAIATRYDELLTSVPRERWIRRGFQALVEQSTRPGSLLLDFGCGTGIDASWYAQRGYRVLAYDISAGMMEELRRRCAKEVAQGTVLPFTAPLASFAATMARAPRPDAVVANYGVVNAMAEPREFFAAVAPLLAPGAQLIVSTLNPLYWQDMRHRWWWAALRNSRTPRALVTRGEGVVTYRHFMSSLAEAARPAFRLTARASLGTLVPLDRTRLDWESPRSLAARLERRLWKTFPLRSLGLWVFLRFERT